MEFKKSNVLKTQYRDGSPISSKTIYGDSKDVTLLLGGNYLPATLQPDGSYIVDVSNVRFSGNIRASGDVQAFVKGNNEPIDVNALASLADVSLTDLQDGQILVYDSVKKLWVNKNGQILESYVDRTTYEQHVNNTAIHHEHSNKNTLDKITPALYSKIIQFLNKVTLMPNGDIQFKNNISSTGEITAHYGSINTASEENSTGEQL